MKVQVRAWGLVITLAVINITAWTLSASRQSGLEAWVVALVILLGSSLIIALALAVPSSLLIRRDRLISQRAPDDVVVAGVSQIEMRLTLAELRPNVRPPAWFAWSAASDGLSLWRGTMNPRRIARMSWTEISGVDEVFLQAGMRTYKSLAFIRSADGRVRSMPFLVQNPRFPALVMGGDEVSSLARALRSKMGQQNG